MATIIFRNVKYALYEGILNVLAEQCPAGAQAHVAGLGRDASVVGGCVCPHCGFRPTSGDDQDVVWSNAWEEDPDHPGAAFNDELYKDTSGT